MSVMHIMLYSISLYVDNHSCGIKKKAVQTTACDESSSPIGNLLMATQSLKQLQIFRLEFGC